MDQVHADEGEHCVRPDDCIACRHRLCALVHPAGRHERQTFKHLQRGNRLLLEDMTCLKFWIVVSGTAAICVSLPDGRRQITSLELSGDLLCGFPSVSGTEAWMEALSDCRVCEVNLSAHAGLLLEEPAVAAKLFRHVHGRLVRSSQLTVALGRLDSMERICFFLLDMARRVGVGENGSVRVDLQMSREDIADYLGLNSETVSRLLTRAKRLGLAIFLSPTAYVISDIAALERRVPLICTEVAFSDGGTERERLHHGGMG